MGEPQPTIYKEEVSCLLWSEDYKTRLPTRCSETWWVYGHTTMNGPNLVWSQKLSRVGPGRYLDERTSSHCRSVSVTSLPGLSHSHSNWTCLLNSIQRTAGTMEMHNSGFRRGSDSFSQQYSCANLNFILYKKPVIKNISVFTSFHTVWASGQNLWVPAKAIPRRKFILRKAYLRKKEKKKIIQLMNL